MNIISHNPYNSHVSRYYDPCRDEETDPEKLSNLSKQLTVRAEVFISQGCLILYDSALHHSVARQTTMNEEGRDSERIFNAYKVITLGNSNSYFLLWADLGSSMIMCFLDKQTSSWVPPFEKHWWENRSGRCGRSIK